MAQPGKRSIHAARKTKHPRSEENEASTQLGKRSIHAARKTKHPRSKENEASTFAVPFERVIHAARRNEPPKQRRKKESSSTRRSEGSSRSVEMNEASSRWKVSEASSTGIQHESIKNLQYIISIRHLRKVHHRKGNTPSLGLKLRTLRNDSILISSQLSVNLQNSSARQSQITQACAASPKVRDTGSNHHCAVPPLLAKSDSHR